MTPQPELHAPGWPELRFHGLAETDGIVWWWEDPQPGGSIKRQPLVPRAMEAK